MNDPIITTIEQFTIKEYRYASGFGEIAIYSPEVIKGAGPVMRGAISRQAGKGCKWVGYTNARSRVVVTLTKHIAISRTIAAITMEMAPLAASVRDISTITEYGMEQKLSNSIRCF